MNEVFEIQPQKGFSSLLFGSSMNDAEKLLGKPEEVVLIDDIDDYPATVWHYWDKGYSLFFDEKDGKSFFNVEIDNIKAELWGKKVFTLNERQIIDLMKNEGIHQYETETEEWGEKRVTFDEVNMDFYFENNNLVSINYGRIIK